MPEFFGRPRQSRLWEVLAQLEATKNDAIGRGIETAAGSIGNMLSRRGQMSQEQEQRRQSLREALLSRGMLGTEPMTGTVVGGRKVWDQGGVPLAQAFPGAGFSPNEPGYLRKAAEDSMSPLDVLKTGRFQPKGEIPAGERITAQNFSKYFELVPQTFIDEKGRVVTTAPAGTKQISKTKDDVGKKEEIKTEKEKSNLEAAYKLYETARDGLVTGLSGSVTGPIMGRMPAFTSGQQIAEGGVAAMAPVLKQLFRVSGEGVFTDRDQQLLLDMVPTRKDRPEAATAKMENIDKIVRAKLRIPETTKQPAGQPAGGLTPEQRKERIAILRAKMAKKG